MKKYSAFLFLLIFSCVSVADLPVQSKCLVHPDRQTGFVGDSNGAYYFYEFEVDPESVNLNSGQGFDWDNRATVNFYYNIMTAGYMRMNTDTNLWQEEFANASSWTVEIRAFIPDDGSGLDGAGRFGLTIIAANYTFEFFPAEGGFPRSFAGFYDNTGWHTYRIACATNSFSGNKEFWVWRDGQMVNPDGVGVAGGDGSSSSLVLLGTYSSSKTVGNYKIDYISMDNTGAYAPLEPQEVLISPAYIAIDEGETVCYDISLSRPIGEFNAYVSISSDLDDVVINGMGTGETAILEFSSAVNTQTVSITAQVNDKVDYKREISISHTINSEDQSWHGLPIPDLNVTLEEDFWCGKEGSRIPTSDINRDCKVDFYDLCLFANHWLEVVDENSEDYSSDFFVDNSIKEAFGVIYNFDGDLSFTSYDPEVSSSRIRAILNSLAGTSIGTITYSISAGSDIMNYPTAVGSNWGWRTSDYELENDNNACHVAKASSCINLGMDAVRVAAENTKKMGMKFIPSYRVNDNHFAVNPMDHYLTGEFWMNNQNMTIAASGGQSPIELWDYLENMLDFRYQQVRQYRLSIIFEAIDRYADVMDGFELDFTRFPVFFAEGYAQDYSAVMTDFVSQVGDYLEQYSSLSSDKTLIVRVPPSLESCNWAGLDIEAWLESGVVDIVVPSQLMTAYHEMNLEEFLAIARPEGVCVFSGILPRYGWIYPFVSNPDSETYNLTVDRNIDNRIFRSLVSNHYAQGTDGIYAFNFGMIAKDADDKYRFWRDAYSEKTLCGTDKVYPVSKNYIGDIENTFQPAKQLPASISSGQIRKFDMLFSEDFNNDSVTLDYLGLRIGWRPQDSGFNLDANSDFEFVVKVNGEIIDSGSFIQDMTAITGPEPYDKNYSDPPLYFWQKELTKNDVCFGENTIEIQFSSGADTFSITDIEIGVIYQKPDLLDWMFCE